MDASGTIITRTTKGTRVELEPSIEFGYALVYANVDVGRGAGRERLWVRGWYAVGGAEGVRVYSGEYGNDEVILTVPRDDYDRAREGADRLLDAASGPVPDPLPAGWYWEDRPGTSGVGGITFTPSLNNPGAYETLRSLVVDQGKAGELRRSFARGVARNRHGHILLRPLTDDEWARELEGLSAGAMAEAP
jgi:hypothetical protein